MYISIAGVYTRYTVDSHLKYYTDYHAVDEDITTISAYGGNWGRGWQDTLSGVFIRATIDTPTNTSDDVASC